jgi:hypothetical protein
VGQTGLAGRRLIAAAKIALPGLILVASDWQFCYNEIAFAIT